MEQEVVDVINGLIKKTKSHQANWFNTESSNSYSIFLGESKVSISMYSTLLADNYIFTIYNSEGKTVVQIDTVDLESADLIEELFNTVTASFTKKEETISSILNILESSGTVGQAQNPEDVLPF